MKYSILIICFLFFSVFSCEYRKSVSKDILIDLTTKGDGLSCEKVYVSLGEEEISRNTFIYGEKFFLNFSNIEGFNKENESAFPGMDLYVIDHSGDTLMKENDLYANYTSGIKGSSLVLNANLTVAEPIASNSNYTLLVKIWDKKGTGKYMAQLGFDVVPNDKIKVEKQNITYREIYIFSEKEKKVITDNKAQYNDNVYVMFEGLSGFKEEAGKVFLGLSLKATDSEGEVILDEKDLIGERSYDISQINTQLAPSFMFSGSNIANPVTCEINVWDKKGDNWIRTLTKIDIK